VQDAAAAAGRDNAAAASGVPAFDPSQLAGVVAQVKTAKSAGKQVQRHARLSRGRREAGERNDAAFHAMAASLGGGGNRITVNTLLQHGQAVRNAATEAQMQQDQEDRAQQRAGHVTAGHNRSHSHASGFRLGGRRDQVAPEGAGHCRSKSAPLPQKCSIM
jgi:hypothetical protein